MENQKRLPEIIVAEIEISYTPHVKPSERPTIITGDDAYRLLMATWDKSKLQFIEQFKIILLNRMNHVLGICTLTTGTTEGTLVDPKLVFAVALKANANKIILVHNHGSGSLAPSLTDKRITKHLIRAGELLDLEVVDHIIVSAEGYYSFLQEGEI